MGPLEPARRICCRRYPAAVVFAARFLFGWPMGAIAS